MKKVFTFKHSFNRCPDKLSEIKTCSFNRSIMSTNGNNISVMRIKYVEKGFVNAYEFLQQRKQFLRYRLFKTI